MAALDCITEMDPVMTLSPSPISVPFTDDELDELADFLDSDLVPTEAMDISMLHGFLTALALSPEPAATETWYPMIWGEDDAAPEFSSATQQAHVESLVQRLFAQIANTIDQSLPSFEPVLYVDDADKLDVARPWCFGFSQGVWLQEEAWAPLFEDDTLGALLDPILDCADDEARAALEKAGEDLAAWEHEVAAALPDIVAEIQTFLHRKS
ncbi:MAG: hypothetical protein RJA63_1716 [Pseudomonadota bacterium]|jgi:uncharacterized protein